MTSPVIANPWYEKVAKEMEAFLQGNDVCTEIVAFLADEKAPKAASSARTAATGLAQLLCAALEEFAGSPDELPPIGARSCVHAAVGCPKDAVCGPVNNLTVNTCEDHKPQGNVRREGNRRDRALAMLQQFLEVEPVLDACLSVVMLCLSWALETLVMHRATLRKDDVPLNKPIEQLEDWLEQFAHVTVTHCVHYTEPPVDGVTGMQFHFSRKRDSGGGKKKRKVSDYEWTRLLIITLTDTLPFAAMTKTHPFRATECVWYVLIVLCDHIEHCSDFFKADSINGKERASLAAHLMALLFRFSMLSLDRQRGQVADAVLGALDVSVFNERLGVSAAKQSDTALNAFLKVTSKLEGPEASRFPPGTAWWFLDRLTKDVANREEVQSVFESLGVDKKAWKKKGFASVLKNVVKTKEGRELWHDFIVPELRRLAEVKNLNPKRWPEFVKNSQPAAKNSPPAAGAVGAAGSGDESANDSEHEQEEDVEDGGTAGYCSGDSASSGLVRRKHGRRRRVAYCSSDDGDAMDEDHNSDDNEFDEHATRCRQPMDSDEEDQLRRVARRRRLQKKKNGGDSDADGAGGAAVSALNADPALSPVIQCAQPQVEQMPRHTQYEVFDVSSESEVEDEDEAKPVKAVPGVKTERGVEMKAGVSTPPSTEERKQNVVQGGRAQPCAAATACAAPAAVNPSGAVPELGTTDSALLALSQLEVVQDWVNGTYSASTELKLRELCAARENLQRAGLGHVCSYIDRAKTWIEGNPKLASHLLASAYEAVYEQLPDATKAMLKRGGA